MTSFLPFFFPSLFKSLPLAKKQQKNKNLEVQSKLKQKRKLSLNFQRKRKVMNIARSQKVDWQDLVTTGIAQPMNQLNICLCIPCHSCTFPSYFIWLNIGKRSSLLGLQSSQVLAPSLAAEPCLRVHSHSLSISDWGCRGLGGIRLPGCLPIPQVKPQPPQRA